MLRTCEHSCVERCLCSPPVKLFPVTCEYIQGEKQFYYRAQRFYEDVPASEEGMMGDFVEISNVDLEGSRQFLKRFVVSRSSGLVVSGPQKNNILLFNLVSGSF